MSIRILLSSLFIVYGLLLPVFAQDFYSEHLITSISIMLSCMLIALTLLSGIALVPNLLIAFYILRVYLTRPYVDLFRDDLTSFQLMYIEDYWWNFEDAKIVYLSLLSLQLSWYLGLIFFKTSKNYALKPFWFLPFSKVDELIGKADWRFWFVVFLMIAMNYNSPIDGFKGMGFGQEEGGDPEFAYGLFRPHTIIYACLFYFILKRKDGIPSSLIYLLPIVIIGINGSLGGSRSALFLILVFVVLSWVYLNYEKVFTRAELKKLMLAALFLPVVLAGGLVAGLLRPILRSGDVTSESYFILLKSVTNLSDPNNPIVNNLDFAITALLHRLSSLEAQFFILSDNFVHNPMDTYNPMQTLMRIVNDILPGTLFPGLLTINQLWDYIYHGNFLNYSSQTWSIQGSLYLYFGHLLAPLIVFLVAVFFARKSKQLSYLLKSSPAFFAFFFFFFGELIDNGTLERTIPVNVVKPLGSFIFLIVSMKLMHLIFPKKKLDKKFPN